MSFIKVVGKIKINDNVLVTTSHAIILFQLLICISLLPDSYTINECNNDNHSC